MSAAAFIDAEKANHPVTMLCKVAGISSSRYYQLSKKTMGVRAVEDAELQREIQEIYEEGRGNYGSPRVHDELGKRGFNPSRFIKRITRRFVPPPADRVVPCMDALESYIHDESGTYDPLVKTFLVHYQFETIHPFIDGNGRVGRLLLAIMLQQCCGLSKPWLYMSEFFERHKDEYVDRLFRISTEGDWTGWTEFCLTGAKLQAEETIARCRKLLALQEEYKTRTAEAGGSIRLAQIVELVFNSPLIQVVTLGRTLGVTYPTAKADIDRLVQVGILKELPSVSPKTYFAPQIFMVAYDQLSTGEGVEDFGG